jgi:hypothetical protein
VTRGAAAALVALVIAAPSAAGEFKLSGSMRLRGEAIADQARPGFARDDAGLVLRTVIGAIWREGPVELQAEVWDSRAYGFGPASAISANDVNALEPVQANVALHLPAVDLRIGRFTLNLGSRRLVAADDYRNTTNGSTGFRADIRPGRNLQATAFWVMPQRRRPDAIGDVLDNAVALDRESPDLQLWGLYASRTGAAARPLIEVAYVGLREADAPARPTRDRRLHSISARMVRAPAARAADVEAEAIYQFGDVSASSAAAAPTLSVSAWFLHVDAGYSPGDPWKTRLSVEFDAASGDRPGGRYARFDTLFGMRRADLAPAGLYNAIGRANLVTAGLRIETAPGPRTDAFAVYRALWAESATDGFSTTGVRDASGRAGAFAGHQLEARVRTWLVPKRLQAELNGVLLLRRGLLRNAPNATPGSATRYASLALTASF